ncbi:universal stress protein [Rhizobium rhizogenes]|uniref:universal stress protein n=1 Tax=Rhizobium rhizogenes TaxID=359 RepID=UPI001573CA15|nr:universal stress protein [Rhizobium rhizogenes]NTF82943.1 universal stress protein [Rhizobium rhizogenes]
MSRKVLIATDGSPHAQKAVEIGTELAKGRDAEVHLVHVMLSGELDADLQRMIEVEHLGGLKIQAEPAVPSVAAPDFPIVFPIKDPGESYRAIQAIGTDILKRAKSVVGAHGVDRVSTHLLDGNPVEEIMTVIDREHPDLVVCGARGLSSLSQLVLGSVSTKIAHRCPATCITVH